MGSSLAIAAMGALALGSGASESPAQAAISPQERAGLVQNYRIPSGPLPGALNAFADLNGLQILYDSAVTRRLTTSGLDGDFAVGQGLDRLLSGTGLSWRFVAKGKTVSIILAQADSGARSDAGPEALPAIDIGAERPSTSGPGNGKPTLTPQNSYVTPVISTGTKTNTPVMNTPVNVQQITEKTLEDQQAVNLAEALQNVSGVYVANGVSSNSTTGAGGVYIRGFKTKDIYQDGFRVQGGLNGYYDPVTSEPIANVQSIEVLKGPAAALYGLTEPGGVVNIVTKDLQETPHYSATQQIGSLAQYRTTVNASGPLTQDKSLLYRVDASYFGDGAPSGSQVDRVHASTYFVAPVVKWNVSESTWVKAEAQYVDRKQNAFISFDPLFNGSFVTIPRNANWFGDAPPSRFPSTYAALTLSHKFDEDWSIKQRVAYNGGDFALYQSTPASLAPATGIITRPLTHVEGLQRSFSTNLDIVGHFDVLGARNTLLLGGDFYRTSFFYTSLFAPPLSTTTVNLAVPLGAGVATSYPTTQVNRVDTRQDTAGLYAQDQIELPYGVFVMAGLRYQSIRQENASGVAANALGRTGVSWSSTQGNNERVTPRFGLLWRPLGYSWVSFYGNYAEGFGPNGFSLIYPGTLAPPTDSKTWEAGAKFEFFEGRLRATADYYYLLKTHTLITDANPLHICGSGSCQLDAGAARSEGLELDVKGEVLPGWDVIVAYTNQDVRVAEGTASSTSGGNLTPGSRFPYTPRNLARLGTTYEFQGGTFKGLKVGATYTYTGSQTIQAATLAYGIPPLLPAYGTVDLMAAYDFTIDGLKTRAQINATNIFDTTYYTSAWDSATAAPKGWTWASYRQYGPPFAVRGSLKVEF